ncbi:Transposase and inactivated derivatives, TnpA family [Klebsiella pneumoniae subsp. rhinoscleromatis]|nr:Transposase and inactivated derivatives, TnpA family [Klebsiella pneumoniae subsp. rhinoscleromatis]
MYLTGFWKIIQFLKIREHTTDTHGYTEIIFALCYLLGYYFYATDKRFERSTALSG